jgi:hypothetical protein
VHRHLNTLTLPRIHTQAQTHRHKHTHIHTQACARPNTLQEADFYKTVQEDGVRALEQNSKENGGKEAYVNMLYSLLKMRQACNHPWLVKGLGQRCVCACAFVYACRRACLCVYV